MMFDLGKLLNFNFKMLAAAGCKNIQIDEPLFTICEEDEVEAAVEAINMAIEGLPKDIHMRSERNTTVRSGIDTLTMADIKQTKFAESNVHRSSSSMT